MRTYQTHCLCYISDFIFRVCNTSCKTITHTVLIEHRSINRGKNWYFAEYTSDIYCALCAGILAKGRKCIQQKKVLLLFVLKHTHISSIFHLNTLGWRSIQIIAESLRSKKKFVWMNTQTADQIASSTNHRQVYGFNHIREILYQWYYIFFFKFVRHIMILLILFASMIPIGNW